MSRLVLSWYYCNCESLVIDWILLVVHTILNKSLLLSTRYWTYDWAFLVVHTILNIPLWLLLIDTPLDLDWSFDHYCYLLSILNSYCYYRQFSCDLVGLFQSFQHWSKSCIKPLEVKRVLHYHSRHGAQALSQTLAKPAGENLHRM